ncbi:hypothetical protein ACHAPT_009955 [Fusarium lateritium]
MDKLPYALISLIISCLLEDDTGDRKPWSKPPPIAQYASISRSWQDAVERHTFSEVKVRSDEFSRFESAFRHTNRRHALSTINYEIVLPRYSQARCWKFERPHEHAENLIVFSRAVHAILSTLHAWQVEDEAVNGAAGSGCRPIHLDMRAESRLDSSSLQRQGIGLYRMGGHFLDFIEPCSVLPKVKRVSEMSIRGVIRPLHPSAAFSIVSALPNLECICIDLLEPGKARGDIQRQHRSVLTHHLSSMNSTSFSSLTRLYLNWDSCEPWDHSFAPNDLRDPSQGSKDALSMALHTISQSLPITELYLYGPFMISSELFWPNDSDSPDSPPHWPTLQCLTVYASIIAPDGTYYYTGTPQTPESEDSDPWWPESPGEAEVDTAGYASDDSRVRDPFNRRDIRRSNGMLPLNNWRSELDPERFNPLVLALSRAVCCMPMLGELEFCMAARLAISPLIEAPNSNAPDMLAAFSSQPMPSSPGIATNTSNHQTTWSSTSSLDMNLEESDMDRDADGGVGLLEEHKIPADRECDPSKCLFCNEANSDVDRNVNHMRRAHGFVIPEKNRLVVEIKTLVDYFHLVIFGYFECLHCGSQRHTPEAAQQHMVDKGHCKFDLYNEDSEFRDFYEFSSYTDGSDDEVSNDGEDGQDIEEEADGAKGAELSKYGQLEGTKVTRPFKFGQFQGPTLRLPSGKLLSHRQSREMRPCHRKPRTKSEATPQVQAGSNLVSNAEILTRAERREDSFAARQLVCLSAKDRHSLKRLPMWQQLKMLAVRKKQIAKAMRLERLVRSRLETRGNKHVKTGR